MTRQRNEDLGSHGLMSLLSCLPANFRTMFWGRTSGGRKACSVLCVLLLKRDFYH